MSPTETKESTKREISVEVPAEEVTRQTEAIIQKYQKLARLPGFRKGHAPRNVLERKFGKALLDDLKFELLSGSFEEVKEEKKLEPVGEPELEAEKIVVEDSSGFTGFDASAIDAVREWRFAPAKRGGVAVVHEVLVPVRFRINRG